MTFDEPRFSESLAQPNDQETGPRRRGVAEEPDHRHCRLLRARRERPRRRAAKRSYELPPPDVDCHATLPWGHDHAAAE
jgi:hypothetical protein